MKVTLAVLLLVACGLIVACHRSPSPNRTEEKGFAPDVLATIDGRHVRLADFERNLKSRTVEAGFDGWPDERARLLEELLKLEAIYARAMQAGFDQRPEIRALIADRFLEEQLKNQPEAPPVSQAEIEEFYRQNLQRFATAEKVRFAVIQLGFSPKATEEKKAAVLRKAESVLDAARALDPAERTFGALAQHYSEDQATRYLGGDAGWVSRQEESRWAPALIDAAFALSHPGELSPLVQTSNACHAVKLIDRKGAGYRPLEEVAETIRYQLAIQKRQRAQQAIYETMMSGLHIEINHALLNKVPPPLRSEPTLALPGS